MVSLKRTVFCEGEGGEGWRGEGGGVRGGRGLERIRGWGEAGGGEGEGEGRRKRLRGEPVRVAARVRTIEGGTSRR